MIDSSVAQSRIDPAAVRRGAFMLPAPSGEQIKGLSVGDLVICLMCHRGAKNRDRFYRDRLWWEWVDVEGFTRDQASQRWRALPIATRAWIARRDEDAPKSDFDAPRSAVGKAVRQIRKSLQIKARPDSAGERILPRGRSTYWRNLLFWNWRHASLFNETTWSIELWGLYESLSNQVRTSIDPQDKTLQRQEAGSRRQSCCLLSKTVCYYDKHLHASERERYAPPGFSALAATARSPAANGSGSLAQRRALWLVWFEAQGTETYQNTKTIAAKWDALSDSERLAIAGPRGWRRLQERHHYAHMVAAIVHQEILRALWERQIQGKPVGYGQKLFFLVDWKRDLTPADSARHWDRVGKIRRRRFSPGQSLPFSERRFKSGPGEIVSAARKSLQSDPGAMAFAEQYASMIGVFGRAPTRKQCGKAGQIKALLAQTEPRLKLQQIATKAGVSRTTVRRIRQGQDSGRATTCPDWYRRLAERASEQKLADAKLLDYLWSLSDAERGELIPQTKWPSYLPHRGYRIASVLRLRHIVSVGKKMIQRSRKDGPDTTKRRRRKGNRSPATLRPLTEKQTEAMALVAEADGNVFEAARRMGVHHTTLRQHYQAGLRKLGKAAIRHGTRALPVDRRGQPNIAQGGDRRE